METMDGPGSDTARYQPLKSAANLISQATRLKPYLPLSGSAGQGELFHRQAEPFLHVEMLFPVVLTLSLSAFGLKLHPPTPSSANEAWDLRKSD